MDCTMTDVVVQSFLCVKIYFSHIDHIINIFDEIMHSVVFAYQNIDNNTELR